MCLKSGVVVCTARSLAALFRFSQSLLVPHATQNYWSQWGFVFNWAETKLLFKFAFYSPASSFSCHVLLVSHNSDWVKASHVAEKEEQLKLEALYVAGSDLAETLRHWSLKNFLSLLVQWWSGTT